MGFQKVWCFNLQRYVPWHLFNLLHSYLFLLKQIIHLTLSHLLRKLNDLCLPHRKKNCSHNKHNLSFKKYVKIFGVQL